ncbi:protein-tyrosine phosphatase domain-containing protein [Phthorimaea operculella]|nr:protein-tyrosine phosphatase domain-containing protein [Phthorimaea operculella]
MIESVSRRAFSSSSGTYNVRASELARDRKLNIINVTVQFLDDTQHMFQIEKKAKGSVLLDLVYQHIELVEKDYFGLQFTENGTVPNATNTEITRWLDSNKSVKKQVGANAQFWLAVRFYPPEPSRLGEEFTKYLLCLQLRKLLLDGRMTAPKNTALLLASFTVQAELGDYNVSEHPPNYLSELCLLPKQSAEDERRIRELHKLHKGQLPADAEANFLEHAKRLDCYGVESHPAKDYNGKDISIGVTSIGIVVFQNNIRVNTFSWSKIVKISFKKKQFFIQLKREPSESYDTVLGFNMRSGRAAKALWRCSVERHGFFRLRAPRRRPFLGALSALAGIAAPSVPRTETQALEDARRERRGRSFVRRSSSRNRERSSSAASPTPPVSAANNNGRTSRVTGQLEPAPRAAWTEAEQPHTQPDDGGFLERALRVPLPYVDESSSASEGQPDDAVIITLTAGSDGRFGFNVRGGGGAPVLVSRVAPNTRPRLQQGDQVGNPLTRCATLSQGIQSPHFLTHVDESSSASEGQPDDAVIITLTAGSDGRFGFNVRGGGGAPVLVSRVAPNTRPRLQQGDQVWNLVFLFPSYPSLSRARARVPGRAKYSPEAATRRPAGSDRRFGFNVRGGGGAPVLVSRVAPNTRPRLQQGDQQGDQVGTINYTETRLNWIEGSTCDTRPRLQQGDQVGTINYTETRLNWIEGSTCDTRPRLQQGDQVGTINYTETRLNWIEGSTHDPACSKATRFNTRPRLQQGDQVGTINYTETRLNWIEGSTHDPACSKATRFNTRPRLQQGDQVGTINYTETRLNWIEGSTCDTRPRLQQGDQVGTINYTETRLNWIEGSTHDPACSKATRFNTRPRLQQGDQVGTINYTETRLNWIEGSTCDTRPRLQQGDQVGTINYTETRLNWIEGSTHDPACSKATRFNTRPRLQQGDQVGTINYTETRLNWIEGSTCDTRPRLQQGDQVGTINYTETRLNWIEGSTCDTRPRLQQGDQVGTINYTETRLNWIEGSTHDPACSKATRFNTRPRLQQGDQVGTINYTETRLNWIEGSTHDPACSKATRFNTRPRLQQGDQVGTINYTETRLNWIEGSTCDTRPRLQQGDQVGTINYTETRLNWIEGSTHDPACSKATRFNTRPRLQQGDQVGTINYTETRLNWIEGSTCDTRPRLQQGNQVLAINDQDVEELTHDEVVQLIRNTRGVLKLLVKPNAVYETEDAVGLEEPAVSFVPFGAGALAGDALDQSMLLLGDGLASGAALTQYETLLRRLPEESTNASKLPYNLNKNRYRDIAPYDSTRVILKNGPTGDYINASYINMEIPNSDMVLTYIATQGPLSSTVGDFWQMVWESESSLIVMLTVLAERGRAKCHQYWPKVGTTPLKATSTLTVHTNSEQNLGHYIRREMSLKETSSGAVRNVTQLQYVAWPDHGVPEDAAAFTSFTQLCASLRNHRAVIPTVVEELLEGEEERLLDPPMIVHCSAGVGRTGALILAETALQLIATRQPLYPLDIVRAMRTMRPMCIQNAKRLLDTPMKRLLDPPMIVHCSAGVGRTGALILAETALQLIATRQPLYPLDIVRAMRTMRPMCIQNASQYKFVCEAIQAAYAQGITAVPPPTTQPPDDNDD